MAEIGWESIKTEYITTNISQRELAAKHGVPLSNLTRRSTKEGWVEERQRYKDRVIAKTVKKAAGRESWKLAGLIEATERAAEVVAGMFSDEEQFYRHLVTGDGYLDEKVMGKADTKALKEAVGVLKDVTGLLREFYNLPTYQQKQARKIAAERLKLEQQKAGERGGAERIEVVMENAGEEAWNE